MVITRFASPAELGAAAADDAAALLRERLSRQERVRVILATGRSQFEFLDALRGKALEWERVDFFHLDEYVGLAYTHKASFRRYLDERFLQYIKPGHMQYLDAETDAEACIRTASEAISAAPVDIAFVGIGENCHLAFNDPPADFDTEAPYLHAQLDKDCRMQQVHEGWFASIDEVPRSAISMSIRQIMKAEHIICCVPLGVKAEAVRRVLQEPVSNMVPASILRNHPHCTLYLDRDSSARI